MTTVPKPFLPIALLVIACTPAVYGDDEPGSASDSDPKPIKIAGTIEAIRQYQVTPDNEQLSDLKIERVVPHGTRVKKGQALVWFQTKKLDQKIRDAETDLRIAKLTMEADEFAHQQFLKQQSLDKAKAQRTRAIAQQEYDNYQKVDRERTIKQAKFSLESGEFSLESASEEYRQLKQMYEEDDLTEESEEIVLRRAKRSMESAAFSLERTKTQTDRTIKQSVPRSDASQEETLARAMMEHDKAMHAMANEKQKRDLELERKRLKFKEQSENFEKMRAERKNVVIKSEIDGIVLFGQLTRGNVPAKPVELKKGTSATGKQILGTVVDPAKLQVRVDLPEEHIALVKKGVACIVVPKGLPDAKLSGVVKSVAIAPYAAGKYDCVVTLRGKIPSDVLPAMTCNLLFTPPSDKTTDKTENEDGGAK